MPVVFVLYLVVATSLAAACPPGEVRVSMAHLGSPSESELARGDSPAVRAAYVRRALERAPADAKLLVLPEHALTPMPPNGTDDYEKKSDAIAVAYRLPKLHTVLVDGELGKIAEIARRRGAFVQLGLFERTDDGHVFNTAIVIDPGGKLVAIHRKNELVGAPDAKEATYATAGVGPTFFDASAVGLGRVGVAVCADIYSDALMERYRQAAVDLLSVSAEWIVNADPNPATLYWRPRQFFEEAATYLNAPARLPYDQRFDGKTSPLTREQRRDRPTHLVVANSHEKAPGAGAFGPGGKTLAYSAARADDWISACLPRAVRPGGGLGAKGAGH